MDGPVDTDDALELFLAKGISSIDSLSVLELSLRKLEDDKEAVVLRGTVSVLLSAVLSVPISELSISPMSGVSDNSSGGDASFTEADFDFETFLGEEGKLSFGLKGSMSEILDIVELFLDVMDFLCNIGVRSEDKLIFMQRMMIYYY